MAVKVKGQEDPILIQTGVKGKLIEVNPAIVSNPKLLLDESEGRGFIAILLPKVKSYHHLQEINFKTQTLCSHRPSYNLKWDASSRWLLSLYCHMSHGPCGIRTVIPPTKTITPYKPLYIPFYPFINWGAW